MFTFALIGLGPRMDEHLPFIARHPDIKITAVVDQREETLSLWSMRLGVPGYTSVDDMLVEHKPDAAVMAVPHHLHFDMTRSLARSKVHVLKEKPLARSLSEGVAMLRLCEEHGIHVNVACQRRHMTSFQLGAAIARSFDPMQVTSEYTLATASPASGWRGSKEQAGGGALIDMGYHVVDLCDWYFGLPTGVSCTVSGVTAAGVENECQLNLTFDTGMDASLLISRTSAPKREFMQVSGRLNRVVVQRGVVQVNRESMQTEMHFSDKGWDRALELQVAEFVRILRGDIPNPAGPRHHLQHLALIEAAYRSAECAGIRLDPRVLLAEALG